MILFEKVGESERKKGGKKVGEWSKCDKPHVTIWILLAKVGHFWKRRTNGQPQNFGKTLNFFFVKVYYVQDCVLLKKNKN